MKTIEFPKRYPVELKHFLRLTLPGLKGRRMKQVAAWREFLRGGIGNHVHISVDAFGWHTVQDIGEHINAGKGIGNEMVYYELARTFTQWYEDWRKEKTSLARSSAAHKRHKKTGARPPRAQFQSALRERKVLD